MVYKITDVKLTHEELSNLLSTALYGCEWVRLENDDDFYAFYSSLPKHLTENDEYIEDKVASVLLNGGKVDFLDLEDDTDGDEGTKHTLTLEAIEKACSTEDGFACAKELFIDEIGDYYSGNNLFQIALFGEVVYG